MHPIRCLSLEGYAGEARITEEKESVSDSRTGIESHLIDRISAGRRLRFRSVRRGTRVGDLGKQNLVGYAKAKCGDVGDGVDLVGGSSFESLVYMLDVQVRRLKKMGFDLMKSLNHEVSESYLGRY